MNASYITQQNRRVEAADIAAWKLAHPTLPVPEPGARMSNMTALLAKTLIWQTNYEEACKFSEPGAKPGDPPKPITEARCKQTNPG